MRLAMLLVAGALAGWLYDQALLGAFLAALACLGWQLFNLFRLDAWLRTGRLEAFPDGSGVWPPVFARIEYMREKARRRRSRWRRSARARARRPW